MDLRDTEAVAEYFKVTKRTVQNWARWGPPEPVRRLLELQNGSHPDWAGIRIGDGELWLPDGTHQTADQILMGPYWLNQLMTESQRCVEFERQLAEVQRVTQAANQASSLHSIAQRKRQK